MSGSVKPRRPKTEEELRDTEFQIASLKEELRQYEGNRSATNYGKNLLRLKEEKAANLHWELVMANAFAARLRQLREWRKLTQAELAKRARIHPETVSLLENGDRVPALLTIRRLADALGVSVEAFQ